MSELPPPRLPPGWRWRSLGELLTDIEAGKSFKCDERPPTASDIGVVKVSAVTWGEFDEHESKTCTDPSRVDPHLFIQAGDFLFSRANTIKLVGAAVVVGAVSGRLMLSDKILRLRFAEDVDPSWVLYVLRSSWGRAEIERLATGNQESMRNIGQDRIRQIRIPWVQHAEQKRIVAEIEKQFTRLDTGVEALRRLQAHLRRYRAAMLTGALGGRLVPSEASLARAEGRDFDSGEALLNAVLSARKELHARAGVKGKYVEPAGPTAGLDRLPEGWTWATLGQLAWDSGYGTSEKCDYAGVGQPVLRIPNIARGMIDVADLKRARGDLDLVEGESLAPGDLLVVRTNGSLDLLGRGAVVEGRFSEPTYFASYLIRFRLPAMFQLARWVGLVWQSPFVRHIIERSASNSAGQYNVNLKALSAVPVPIPPVAEQARIIAELERRASNADALESVATANLLRARRLRAAVLCKAFEGSLATAEMPDRISA